MRGYDTFHREQERPVQATDYLTARDPQVQTATGQQPQNQVTAMAPEGSGEADRVSVGSEPMLETEPESERISCTKPQNVQIARGGHRVRSDASVQGIGGLL